MLYNLDTAPLLTMSKVLFDITCIFFIIGMATKHKVWSPIGKVSIIVASLAVLVLGAPVWVHVLISICFQLAICVIIGVVIRYFINKSSSKKIENAPSSTKVSSLIVKDLSNPKKIKYDPQRKTDYTPQAKYKHPTEKEELFVKKFFLDNLYKKFRRRLFLAVSIIAGLICAIVSKASYEEGVILYFLSVVALTWIAYGTIIWITKALPD